MNELQTMLGDTVNRLFGDVVTQELLESVEGGQWPAALWNQIEEAGLTRPHLSEEVGGSGASWLDVYPIINAAGRHAAPAPLAETILASWLLMRAGLEVPEGPIALLPERVPEEAFDGGTLKHRSARVPWGRWAKHVVFVGDDDDKTRIGIASTSGAAISPGENLAREPRDGLVFNGAKAQVADAILPSGPIELFGAMIRSAQMAGALEAILQMSVQYAGERVQFGKPIGRFQIIQQELARLAGETAASGVAAKAAFRAADRVGIDSAGLFDPSFEIAAAKIRAGEAAELVTGIAHQVHGAIGFTYEHKLHFLTRRLWSWRAEFGADSYWAVLIGVRALQRSPDELWSFLTSRE